MSSSPSSTDHTTRPHQAGLRSIGIVLLALLMVVVAACSSDEELGGEVVEDGLGCTLNEVDRRTDDVPTVDPEVEVGDEAATEDLIDPVEEACQVDSLKYLTLDVVGATVPDGEVFTSTFADDRAITARLGQNQLLPALESSLAGLAVGGRRQIVVPAALGYGPDGNESQGIGPDEDLVFVVDLVSLTDEPTVCNPLQPLAEGVRDTKPTDVALPVDPVEGDVVVTVLREGDGPEATATDYVTVDYLGVSCAYGTQFDSSWDREDPITFAMAEAEPTATASTVIPGWTEGIEGQSQGSLVQLDIPAEVAYGAQGRPPSIGPNDPLTFVIDILEVAQEAPAAPEGEDPTVVPE